MANAACYLYLLLVSVSSLRVIVERSFVKQRGHRNIVPPRYENTRWIDVFVVSFPFTSSMFIILVDISVP